MGWHELIANCDRVVNTKVKKGHHKMKILNLKKALQKMDGNKPVTGYSGLKYVGKYALYDYKSCQTCDALVLTCTRDQHRGHKCHGRKIEATPIIGVGSKYWCCYCLDLFDSKQEARIHMSGEMSEAQLKKLGYRAVLFKDLKPIRPG